MMLRFGWAVTMAAALGLGLGCQGSIAVGSNDAIFIQGVLAPSAPGPTGLCTYTSDPTQPTQSLGTLDCSLASRYVIELLVGNRATGSDATVAIQGAVVTVTDASGMELTAFTAATTATIDPASSSSTPSSAALDVIVVDPGTIARFLGTSGEPALPSGDSVVTVGSQQQILANIRLFGQQLGGQSVTAPLISYPIELCLGCLVENVDDGVCTTLGSTTKPVSPCMLGEDQPVDCSLCQGDPICVCGNPMSCVSAIEEPPDAGK